MSLALTSEASARAAAGDTLDPQEDFEELEDWQFEEEPLSVDWTDREHAHS